MSTWINFKELREKVRIADVLAQYDVQLKVRGEKATCLCPLPTHPMRGDGKKRTASFSVHLPKGIFHCFGCGAKSNEANHPYLIGRGFNAETIKYFGLGFCSRGMMKDRIAIPIHDPGGRLVGYAGRLVDNEMIDEEHPRYLFPGSRNRDGVVHEF